MATKKNETIVMLPEIDFRIAHIKIKGTSPLVTNPFSWKQMKQIEDKQHGIAKAKKHDIRNEWADFVQAIYWLSEPPKNWETNSTTEDDVREAMMHGRYGFAAGGLKDSAVVAAVRRGIVKNKPVGQGMFRILGAEQDKIYQKQCIEILTDEPPVMRSDCLSTFNSGADMRYRPQFNDWRMEFDIEYDASMVTIDQLLMWFKAGGFMCGLGENRAEKGGEAWGCYALDM